MCPLAGGNVSRFGQTEGEPTAFFQTNHGSGSSALRNVALRNAALRNLGIASVPSHEKAGGLNRQVHACEVDRIESQADIATIAPEVGGPGRLHSTCDGGAARDQSVPLDDNGFVDDRLEGSVGAWILGGYRVLQPNREQCTGWQILGIVERKTRFGVQGTVLRCRSATLTGDWCPFPIMKGNRMLVRVSGSIATLQPGRTGATRRPY